MVAVHESIHAADGDPLRAEEAREVLRGAELVYDDGAIQQFAADGTTMYAEAGHQTHGEWAVDDDGSFTSFWPPSFRARYTLKWRVTNQIVGLTFVNHGDGSVFSGNFRMPAAEDLGSLFRG